MHIFQYIFIGYISLRYKTSFCRQWASYNIKYIFQNQKELQKEYQKQGQ